MRAFFHYFNISKEFIKKSNVLSAKKGGKIQDLKNRPIKKNFISSKKWCAWKMIWNQIKITLKLIKKICFRSDYFNNTPDDGNLYIYFLYYIKKKYSAFYRGNFSWKSRQNASFVNFVPTWTRRTCLQDWTSSWNDHHWRNANVDTMLEFFHFSYR